MGATLAILHKGRPNRPTSDNPARLGWGVPLPELAEEFEPRFGVRLVELYGSTDVGVPIYTRSTNRGDPGRAAAPIAAYDVRLVDETDATVADRQGGRDRRATERARR